MEKQRKREEEALEESRIKAEIEKLNEKIEDILTTSKVAASKLLSQIDQDIHQQADFLKSQNSLLQKSCMDFRKVLARIFFLEFVGDTFKIDPNSVMN